MKTKIMLIGAVLFVIFTLVAFVAPFENNASLWVAYIFGIIAIASQFYFFKSAFKQGESARSKVYGFPIARTGIIYLVVQLVASILEMAFSVYVPFWVCIIVNAIILGLGYMGCIATETARVEVERQDAQVSTNTSSMNEMRVEIQGILDSCDCEALIPELKKLSDEFSYSDPVSNNETMPLELKLYSSLSDLRRSIENEDYEIAKDQVKEAQRQLDNRNRVCKMHKKSYN